MAKSDKYVYVGCPSEHTDNTPWFGTVGKIVTTNNDVSFVINKSTKYCVNSNDILEVYDFLHKANTLLGHKTIFITGGDELQQKFVYDYLRIADYYDDFDMYENIVVGMQNDCCQAEISTHCDDYTSHVVAYKPNNIITMMTLQDCLYFGLKT